jgi:general secretion pathway protein M
MSESLARRIVPQSWLHAWERASPRERIGVVAAVAVVGIALLWSLVWLPLTRDLARLVLQQPNAAATLVAAQALADDVSTLTRAAPAPRAGDLRSAIDRTLNERGLRGPGVSVDAQDDRVRVVLPAVPFPALVAALDAARKSAGAWIVEGTVTPRVEPGTVRAELVFAR